LAKTRFGGTIVIMRRGAVAAGASASALFAGVVLAGVAIAEPRATGNRSGRPAPSFATAGPAAMVPAPATTGTGAMPPPPPPEGGDGGKLSPLNPAQNEFSDAGPLATSIDYDRLLADVASLRARAAAVSDILFHSRVAISIQTSGDHGHIAGASVALDDGNVWTAPDPFRAEDPTTVYEHAVAPGNHAVTVEIERRDDRNEAFRSSQRSRFVLDVPADARLSLDIKLGDDSSMGADFPTDKSGQYDLRVRAKASARPLAQGK
jgi:hypothetical protein